jgi:hypothetical protein
MSLALFIMQQGKSKRSFTRFQIFTQSQAAQNEQYVGYDHMTAKLATINLQTQQKI